MHNNKKHFTNPTLHIDLIQMTDRQLLSGNDKCHGWREIKNIMHAKDSFPTNTGKIIVSSNIGQE